MSTKIKLYIQHKDQLYVCRFPPNLDLHIAFQKGWRRPATMQKLYQVDIKDIAIEIKCDGLKDPTPQTKQIVEDAHNEHVAASPG